MRTNIVFAAVFYKALLVLKKNESDKEMKTDKREIMKRLEAFENSSRGKRSRMLD